MGNYISCSGVSDISFKNLTLLSVNIKPITMPPSRSRGVRIQSRALHTQESLEEIKVQERQRNSSRVRSSVTSALDPGVPGMVLILGEGTVPAQNHIRKAFGVVSTRSIHLIPWNKNDDSLGLSEG